MTEKKKTQLERFDAVAINDWFPWKDGRVCVVVAKKGNELHYAYAENVKPEATKVYGRLLTAVSMRANKHFMSKSQELRQLFVGKDLTARKKFYNELRAAYAAGDEDPLTVERVLALPDAKPEEPAAPKEKRKPGRPRKYATATVDDMKEIREMLVAIRDGQDSSGAKLDRIIGFIEGWAETFLQFRELKDQLVALMSALEQRPLTAVESLRTELGPKKKTVKDPPKRQHHD